MLLKEGAAGAVELGEDALEAVIVAVIGITNFADSVGVEAAEQIDAGAMPTPWGTVTEDGEVVLIHAQEKVEIVVVAAAELTGAVLDGDAMAAQGGHGTGIGRIAYVPTAGAAAVDDPVTSAWMTAAVVTQEGGGHR